MREILNVWKKPRLLVLASFTAAIYAAVLIPFKYGLPIVPGATEIRPGIAVLLLCGFLFGPAAAWGGAFGNLIGDFFGATLGVGSIFGFVGNFLLAYLPYRAWEVMRGGRAIPKASPLWWLRYIIAVLLASGACAGVIAWGLDVAFRLPFFILGGIIFINNAFMGLILAPLLLLLIVPRMESWGFTYSQMEPSSRKPGAIAATGLIIVLLATAAIMVGGHLLSRKEWIEAVAKWFLMPDWLTSYPPATLAPFVIALILGTVMMGSGHAPDIEEESAPVSEETAPQADKSAILNNVSFRYEGSEHRAVEDVSLEIDGGEFVVLMGRTGAGKTTLARCLTGAVPNFYPGDFSGNVSAEGCNPTALGPAETAHCVGMVFEDFESQLFSTNVSLEVAFGPENLGVPQLQIEETISSSLREVGLDGFEDREPSALSGGEKQRLAIAATLAMDSKMLILDEPTTDLDPLGKQELYGVLDKLTDGRKTLLLIEHEAEAATKADRVILMKDGKIEAVGGPQEILCRPELLEEHGVRSHDSVKLLSALGESSPPLDVEGAVTRLGKIGSKFDDQKYSQLLDAEKRRESSYGEEIIRVEGLRHIYPGGNEALRGVDFAVRKGEFVALLGHNGSGKTTLAKHLNGLLAPTEGRVLLDSRPVSDFPLSHVARRVGYVFQNPDHQIFSATVADEVAFAPTNFGLPSEEIKARVQEALDATGLVGRENQDPFHVTKGERQRVAVAGVLAGAPEVIILDEPTTGLDLDEQRSIMELLKRLNEEGHTVIIITHTVWVAAQYAHRIALMTEGRILADDGARRVFGMDEALSAARVAPPQITRIGKQAFGKVFLSVDEMLGCFNSGGN